MQVRLNLKLFLFFLFFCLIGDAKIYFLLIIFAFFHECGHIIMRNDTRL